MADMAAGYCSTVNPWHGYLKKARSYLWTPVEMAGSFQCPPVACTSSERYLTCLPGRLPVPEAIQLVSLLSSPQKFRWNLCLALQYLWNGPWVTSRDSKQEGHQSRCIVPSCEKKLQTPDTKQKISLLGGESKLSTHSSDTPTIFYNVTLWIRDRHMCFLELSIFSTSFWVT